ncbi:MAG: hypothetical protein HY900_22685 [Deltaproteobacteria bacterium]|nr:hypothetical protein [Deltaproteobacteria bacterium]
MFDYDESISLIARNCKVPIYSSYEFNIGYALAVGGTCRVHSRIGQGTRVVVEVPL